MQYPSMNIEYNLIKKYMIESYLKSKEWFEHFTDDNQTIFRLNGNALGEVVIPTSNRFDYIESMMLVLKKISIVENRPEEYIFNDIINYGYDVLRVYLDDNPQIFNMPDAIRNIKEIYKVTALSIEKPKNYYISGNLPKKVDNFLKDTLLGQTERGSYILTIMTPLCFTENNLYEEPKERKLTNKIFNAIHKVTEIADMVAIDNQNISIFTNYINDGVNANLCDSIADICNNSCKSILKFKMTWSNIFKPTATNNEVVIRKGVTNVISAGSKLLKETGSIDIEETGYVVGLEKEKDENSTGDATVAFETSTGRIKHIKITLPLEKYNIAIDAHKLEKQVVIKGQAQQKRNFLIMEELELFDFLQSPDKKD